MRKSKTNTLQSQLLLFLLCLTLLLLQLRGGIVGKFGLMLSCTLTAAIVFSANPRYLGGLLVLYLAAEGAGMVGYSSITQHPYSFLVNDLVTTLVLPGLSITVPLVFGLFANIRVFLSLLYSPSRFSGVVPAYIFLLWLISFLPAFVGAIQGKLLGYQRWSAGVRVLLIFGCFFWGVLVGQKYKNIDQGIKKLSLYIFIGSILAGVGIIQGHLLFIISGLSAALCPIALVYKKPMWGLTLAAVATYLGVSITFTTFGCMIIGFGLSTTIFATRLVKRKLVANLMRFSWIIAIIGIIAIALMATVFASNLNLTVDSSEGIFGEFGNKLIIDRGTVWLIAINQILTPPYLIVPAGRPLIFDNSSPTWVGEYDFGSHNGFLEALRQAGLLAGSFGLIVAFFSIFLAFRVVALAKGKPWLQGIAAGLSSVAIVGMMTGNFPVNENIGVLLWGFLGVVVGIERKDIISHSKKQ